MKSLILDANVLIRFLVQDEPRRNAAVNKLMSDAQAGAYELHLDPMIIAEIVYVLSGIYKKSRADVANLLLVIVHSSCVKVMQETEIVDALLRFRDHSVDFADAWLAAKSATTKYEIASFDRDLDKFDDIVRFEPKQ